MAKEEPVIGIDLGTTNCAVATVSGGQPTCIKNRSGERLTPSVVAYSASGKWLVGQMAKRQAITNPESTVYATKRLIGRKFSSREVQQEATFLSYPLYSGQHDDVRVRLGGKELSLPEVSALVLKELKADAEAFFGQPVTKAVITVPAYFNDGQRQATKDAGAIAGLEVLRILNEPTAAALAYGAAKRLSGKVAVFDMGGGTFDVSVLSVDGSVFDVLATGGDSHLGGEDFDHRVLQWLVTDFAKAHGVDLRSDKMALQRLKDASERAKIELSGTQSTQIHLPFLYSTGAKGSSLHLSTSLSRSTLEELTMDLSSRAIRICRETLAQAKLKQEDLREIILVGGMTRMPRLAEEVREYFRREASRGVHPEEAVALGAALHAHSLAGRDKGVLLLDVTPQSLGVAIVGGYTRRLIPKNTTVPTSTTEVFTTSKDGQTVVKIRVLQGESEMAGDNELLGEFVLNGLREAARGDVKVEVTFDINSEGIVAVSGKDLDTGAKQSITVTAQGGLTPEELEKILQGDGGQLPAPRG
jgi:molecular chaperone DnaK